MKNRNIYGNIGGYGPFDKLRKKRTGSRFDAIDAYATKIDLPAIAGVVEAGRRTYRKAGETNEVRIEEAAERLDARARAVAGNESYGGPKFNAATFAKENNINMNLRFDPKYERPDQIVANPPRKVTPSKPKPKKSAAEILYPNDKGRRNAAPILPAPAKPSNKPASGRKLTPAEILYPNDKGPDDVAPVRPAPPKPSNRPASGRKLTPAEILYPNDGGRRDSMPTLSVGSGDDTLLGGAENDILSTAMKFQANNKAEQPSEAEQLKRVAAEEGNRLALRGQIFDNLGLEGDPNERSEDSNLRRMRAAETDVRERRDGRFVPLEFRKRLLSDGEEGRDAPFLERFRAENPEHDSLTDDELMAKAFEEFKKTSGVDLTRKQFDAAIEYESKPLDVQDQEQYYREHTGGERWGHHAKFAWLSAIQAGNGIQLGAVFKYLNAFDLVDRNASWRETDDSLRGIDRDPIFQDYNSTPSMRKEQRAKFVELATSTIESIVDIQEQLDKIPSNPVADKTLNADNIGDALTYFIMDWSGTLQQLIVRNSLKVAVTTAAGAVVGPGTAALVAGTFGYGIHIIAGLHNAGVDIHDRAAIREAMQGPMYKEIIDQATVGAVKAGIFKAVPGGAAKVVR